jgi:signal transduction histidine kinase
MGLQAVRIGLKRSDLANIHAAALATLEQTDDRLSMMKRAELFLAEAIIPMEQTERSHLKAKVDFTQVNEALDTRSSELVASNRSLKQNIVRCKTVQKDLQRKGDDAKRRLKESNRRQKYQRDLAHRIISAQEDRRTRMSHELQDEIAQTLLGINVHLLTLKKAATGDVKVFRKSIASTQRLVEESIWLISRFARELNLSRQP